MATGANTAAQAKADIVEATALLFDSGVMSFSGHGNLSTRLGDDQIAITRTPFIRHLTPDDVSPVPMSEELAAGVLDPVVEEVFHMHADVYAANPAFQAIIHTHSPNATSFALAESELPCAYESLLRQGIDTTIPVVPWAPRGSEKAVSGILDTLKAHPEAKAVLLGNHGVLAFGDSILQAARIVVAVEEAALMTMNAVAMGGARSLPEGALALERAQMQRFGSTTV